LPALTREALRAAHQESDNDIDSLTARAAQLLEYMEVAEIAEMFMDQGHDAGLVFLTIQAGIIIAAARG